MGGEGGSHSRGSRKELRVYSRELHVLGEAVTGLERHGCDGIENWGRSRKQESQEWGDKAKGKGL